MSSLISQARSEGTWSSLVLAFIWWSLECIRQPETGCPHWGSQRRPRGSSSSHNRHNETLLAKVRVRLRCPRTPPRDVRARGRRPAPARVKPGNRRRPPKVRLPFTARRCSASCFPGRTHRLRGPPPWGAHLQRGAPQHSCFHGNRPGIGAAGDTLSEVLI